MITDMKAYTKKVFFEFGTYCTFLGFLGVLSLIFTGMFCYLLGFSSNTYYILLGVLFVGAVMASAWNVKCNSSFFKQRE